MRENIRLKDLEINYFKIRKLLVAWVLKQLMLSLQFLIQIQPKGSINISEIIKKQNNSLNKILKLMI